MIYQVKFETTLYEIMKTYVDQCKHQVFAGLHPIFTYMRNWKITNGNYPSSSKDTEKIFIEIFKAKVYYTITNINDKRLELPKPPTRYIAILKEKTEKARIATSNQYFKFDEEDGAKTFNKRKYFLDQSKSKLYAVCKANGIKKN